MTHVITQNCCNDANCVAVCPVDCIHPTPAEAAFNGAEMLYIDPSACTDCGVCVDVCPVNAIYSDDSLPTHLAVYRDLNANYYSDPARRPERAAPSPQPPMRRWQPRDGGPLRVAIVGAGPSGSYAAEELLTQAGLHARVDMFERLPAPGGLVRYGVAPDHGNTKQIESDFGHTMKRVGFRLIANTEVGRTITHEQLASRYHAVIYAVGAMADRPLGIPGESLGGSHSATEFVAWYNGHPDYAGRQFDLHGERAVVVGNGNVALDVARVLLADPATLRRTDIADHALECISRSRVNEVVVIGRRGPAEAAFTTPELLGLQNLDGIDVIVPASDLPAPSTLRTDGHSALDKLSVLHQLSRQRPQAGKRIVLRFQHSPVEILGKTRVEGIRLARNDLIHQDGKVIARPTTDRLDITCGLVLRSVGYRGQPIPGLPFDQARGTLPQAGGRVIRMDGDQPVRGVYAVGWIKRGPSGVIGTNKTCARETVSALLEDYDAGRLPTPVVETDILKLAPESTDLAGWSAIDSSERQSGLRSARPRVKIVDRATMLEVARRR